MSDEVRKTDPDTGAEKGSKLARFDLIPAEPLWKVAEHYGIGAEKYADHNWRKRYAWGLSFAAMMRHAWAFWGGEDIDPETGSPHMAAVVFHAFALLEYGRTNRDKDDRWVDAEPTVALPERIAGYGAPIAPIAEAMPEGWTP